LLEHGFHGGGVGDVGPGDQGSPSGRLDFVGELLGCLRLIGVVNHDSEAISPETFCDGRTYAAGCACHDGSLLEVRHDRLHYGAHGGCRRMWMVAALQFVLWKVQY
jgi:hypothetical protein